MTAKEIANEFKKTAGKGLNPIRTAKAEAQAVRRLVEGYNEIQKKSPAKTDLALFELFDFMNLRANKLRLRLNAEYKTKAGEDVMGANAFNKILESRAPEAWKSYQEFKADPVAYNNQGPAPLKIVE